jgi:glycosyltransferase involved in cell wall biosynthesis
MAMTTGFTDARLKRAIVAIPARDEEARIGACLRALTRQIGIGQASLGVVVFVNGSSDGTARVVRSMSAAHELDIRLIEDRATGRPDAGRARRTAMEAAAEWLGPPSQALGGVPRRVILTTDADTVVPPDWVVRNLRAIDDGASAVAGAFDIDPVEEAALPAMLRLRLRLEARYEALTTELACRLDPQPHDPWPRHAATSGASLAVGLETYLAVGGMPSLPVGEDRAFVDALVAAGGLVRHDPQIRVRTSGRLVGRAVGGFSDGMRLRARRWNDPCDERLRPIRRLLGGSDADKTDHSVLRPTDLPAQIVRASAMLGAMRIFALCKRSVHASSRFAQAIWP